MIKTKPFRACVASLMCLTGLSACSLPNTGPSVATIRDSESTANVSVVKMTSVLAAQMLQQSQESTAKSIEDAVSRLSLATMLTDHRLQSGDMLSIHLWSYSPWPSGTTIGAAGTPNAIDAGTFEVDAGGRIDLPYARSIKVSGLTKSQAQSLIAQTYVRMGVLQKPSVVVNLTDKETNGVLVTGAIGQPRIIPWSSGGLTTAKALTLAMGGGSALASSVSPVSKGNEATIVSVIRHGETVSLPLDVALQRDIPLTESDKIIVTQRASVQVTMMGGGLTKNGLYGFAERPSLAQALAQGQGLSGVTADSRAVFVYRLVNGKHILYDFSWNKVDAILASQEFPLYDSDIIYVAESPVVPVTRVLNTIAQFAIVASIARP